MTRFIACASLMAALLVTTACTQPSAQIDLKGQNDYGRNGNGASYASNNSGYQSQAASKPAPAYSSNTPAQPAYGAGGHSVSQATEQNAAVQSIGVSDLAPPSASPAPAAPKAQTSSSTNPWTNKPRGGDMSDASDQSFSLRPQGKSLGKGQMVSDVKAAPVAQEDKSIAQMDSIVAKDASPAKPAAKAVAANGFMWPVGSKKVLSAFGPKGGGKANDGINIASGEGEPVWAAADGEVVYVGNQLQGYGNMVLIKHSGDKTTSYAHMSRATVDKYDHVKQGDIIGYVGSTGSVKEPQLYFAIREGKEPVDPAKYLNRNVAALN